LHLNRRAFRIESLASIYKRVSLSIEIIETAVVNWQSFASDFQDLSYKYAIFYKFFYETEFAYYTGASRVFYLKNFSCRIILLDDLKISGGWFGYVVNDSMQESTNQLTRLSVSRDPENGYPLLHLYCSFVDDDDDV